MTHRRYEFNKPKCSVAGCNKDAVGRKLCRKHYMRWYKSGNPALCETPKGAILEWLEEHKTYNNKFCLIWPFGRTKIGIAQCKFHRKPMNAARAMCFLVNGEPPSPKHHAAHNCGKAHIGCVNPRHIRWATASENQLDRNLHGTSVRGETNFNAKLKREKVLEIRKLVKTKTHREIAKQYGICRQYVSALAQRRAWSWL